MSASNISEMIPEHYQGKSLDLEEKKVCTTISSAKENFQLAVSRIKTPSAWHELTGALAAKFTPYNLNSGEIRKGDFIQIDLPAPGPAAGEGHDWVKVDHVGPVESPGDDESFGITLKVTVNPEKPEEGIAHFFDAGATSTFIVTRKNNIVRVKYHGRNEKPNTSNEGIGDKLRNTVVALGAMAGMSELQWKALIKGLIASNDNEN